MGRAMSALERANAKPIIFSGRKMMGVAKKRF
jgi:hypothetical protein